MGSSIGTLFRISTFGESHGPAVGVLIDGCPPGLHIDLKAIQSDLNRRRPGQSHLTTQRSEQDHVELLSGVFEGVTTGTPIALLIRNKDARSRNYETVKQLFRPGHGDHSYFARYGIRDHRGGGRASARETAARVAAASIARQWLSARYGVTALAWVNQIGSITADIDPKSVTLEQVEAQLTRCPDHHSALKMEALITEVKKEGDTLGGVISAKACNVPAGWGDPVFDKLEADLAKACLSLPACKGFEIGSGFSGTTMRGSEHNDEWGIQKGQKGQQPQLLTNHAGGTLAGISSGADILIRCAFKPVSTHFKSQNTVHMDGSIVTFKNEGRHDPCVLPRAVPLVEAALLLTLADHALRTEALQSGSLFNVGL